MHRLTQLAVRFPRLTLFLAAALSAICASEARRVPSSAGAQAMIGPDHPALRQIEAFTERFGGGEPAVIAWSCARPGDPCVSAFDDASLRMAHAAGSAIAAGAHVLRVSSPAGEATNV